MNHSLTPQELRVVELLAKGQDNRQIAEELRLTEHTVKNYLYRVFDKLGVCNRVTCARWYWERYEKQVVA
jgi:DNA-binding NarL/FixJ family response regulator